jgi:Domain of unknown function (DUF4388)
MLRGTLTEFSLFEITRLISETKKTGVLEISGPSVTGQILFSNGAVYGSRSAGAREPLGRKLVRAGVVSEEQLREALLTQVNTNRRLGRILIDSGTAPPERVNSALKEQTEEGAVSILRLDPIEFTWLPEPPEAEPLAAVPATDFLASVATRLEEVEGIRARLTGDGRLVSISPSAAHGGSGVHLDPEEWRIVALLGARRSVSDLIQYSGAGEVQTLLTLDRLIASGLLELDSVDGRTPDGERPPASSEHHSSPTSSAPAGEAPTRRVIHLTEQGKISGRPASGSGRSTQTGDLR